MDAHFPDSDPICSPSSSDVFRFWEESVLDANAIIIPQHPHDLSPPNGPSPDQLDEIDNLSYWDLHGQIILHDDGRNNKLGQTDGSTVGEGNLGIPNVDYLMAGPSSSWVPSNQSDCSSCQVLRQILHSNGIDTMMLQIHGAVGVLYHAVIETVQYGVDGAEVSIDRHVVDFSMATFEDVKQYLMAYGQMRQQERFTLIQDSTLPFYDALCTGMNGGDATYNTNLLVQPVDQSGQGEITPLAGGPSAGVDGSVAISNPDAFHQTAADSGQLRPPPNAERSPSKVNIAAQRERTRKLKMQDLVDHFHLPIHVASERLSICSTVLKKVCRKNGLDRWPYRKVKSIERRIIALRQSRNESNGRDGNASVQAEIEKLQRELAHIFKGLDVKG